MNIIEFKFENKSLDWKLDGLILRRLTLLVGASGVGKTQILRAILGLKDIANGKSLNGIAWYVEFTTIDEMHYIWEGEFENKGISVFIDEDEDEENEINNSNPKIIREKLSLNKKVIVNRTPEKILFNGKPTLKLPQQKSIINTLKEEDKIKPAFEGLRKILLSDQSDSVNASRGFSFSFLNANKLQKKYNTLKKIQESDLETSLKLFFVSKVDKKTFSLIRDRFIDIFPQIEDLKVAPLETREKEMPDFLKDYPFIQIKEKNVKHWISQNRISSGMFRTLIQLSELYLSSDGTIFLIDEFENSLGINCINELTSDILICKRKLQFIVTSHHPYIIDAVPFSHWKLVTRKTGVVKTHDMNHYNFGKSKHSAFMQLLQLEEYQTGIEAK